jgi:anti-anti-sigma regulatory factor
MSIHTMSEDGVMVVALAGSADAAMLEPLRAPLTEALADTPVVVLALDDLAGVDTDALRSLVVGLVDDAPGGELRISAGNPDLRSALATARIHHLVAVHDTVRDATRQPSSTR